MAVITNQVLESQKNQIRRMMHEEFKTDDEIIKQLNIHWTTLYDYKNRIQQEDSKIWDLVHQDSSKFRGVQLLADLDRCRMKALAMSEDKSLSGRDRLEALKTSCEASANIFKLLNEGLSFQVSIPSDKLKAIRLETQEDKPKEDKDLVDSPEDPDMGEPSQSQEPVPEHNNVLEDNTAISEINKIPVEQHKESWGVSLQRPNHSQKPLKHKLEQIKKSRVKKIVDDSLQLADLP